jgi:hypothetical protein
VQQAHACAGALVHCEVQTAVGLLGVTGAYNSCCHPDGAHHTGLAVLRRTCACLAHDQGPLLASAGAYRPALSQAHRFALRSQYRWQGLLAVGVCIRLRAARCFARELSWSDGPWPCSLAAMPLREVLINACKIKQGESWARYCRLASQHQHVCPGPGPCPSFLCRPHTMRRGTPLLKRRINKQACWQFLVLQRHTKPWHCLYSGGISQSWPCQGLRERPALFFPISYCCLVLQCLRILLYIACKQSSASREVTTDLSE